MDHTILSLHEHKIFYSYAKKTQNQVYEINGYYYLNKNEKKDLSKEYYLYVGCSVSNCEIFQRYVKCKTFSINDYKVLDDKAHDLINVFNDFDKVEHTYYTSDPHKNVYNLKSKKFYIFNGEYDDNIIYLGTKDEKISYFHDQLMLYKKKNSVLKSKNKSLSLENESLSKKYSDLSNSNKILNSKRTSLEKNLEEMNSKNRTLAKNLKKINSKNTSLTKNLEEKNSRIIFLGDKFNEKETYDIVISIFSMIGLSKEGWLIKYPKGKDEYLRTSAKKTIIIGLVGNGNKGKSFILGKLTGYNIPQGFTIKTEGLSIRYSEKEDHCIAILDSAGQETPLLTFKYSEKSNASENELLKKSLKDEKILEKDESPIFERCLRDKLITETFIQQFNIETSHILLLVVGSITLNEQKILERVKKSMTSDKYLYVIHNLQNLQSKEQVEGYIENTLKKLLGIKIEEKNFQSVYPNLHQKYYVEAENNKITHLIFVNDYSSIAPYIIYQLLNSLKKN